MKPRLLYFLACPIDQGALELVVWDAEERVLTPEDAARARAMGIAAAELTREIRTGVLVNRRLGIYYPIHEGVPRLLTFPTGVAASFARTHAARLAAELPGVRAPAERAMPGEQDVLRTFSSEWVNYDWDDA